MRYDEYRGISHKQAYREADRLLHLVRLRCIGWQSILDRMMDLKEILERPDGAACADDCVHPSHKHENQSEIAAPDEINPKDAVAADRAPISLIPPAALVVESLALRYGAFEAERADGGIGYNPYNWRDQCISYMKYLSAMMRHIGRLIDREDLDHKSMVHGLGHVRATAGILYDAIEGGWIIDDRPKKGPAPKVISDAETFIRRRREETSK